MIAQELDNGGDPPRVWAPGKSFPGCAFTRSIGDSVAESIGVTAEPELLRKELTDEDQFVVLVTARISAPRARAALGWHRTRAWHCTESLLRAQRCRPQMVFGSF